ncbi:MAG: membrane protein insertion efficiency factor YidD [Spirochaetales bacterium]|nr:membrane protein insertion efficiency factor YidD [Spirochaetales bacterium]
MNFFKIITNIIRFIFILPIIIYQKLISPMLPGSCIYYPTCSHYSKSSILKHGILKGFVLAFTRISRCTNTLFDGGEDQVPERFSLQYISKSYRNFWRFKK